MDIAGCAAKSDHRIVLGQLEILPAEQRGIFVRLEIGRPDYDRTGMECSGNCRHSFGKARDKIIRPACKARCQRLDLLASPPAADPVRGQQRHGMRLDFIGDDKFDSGETDTRHRQGSDPERRARIGNIDHEIGIRLLQLADIDGLHGKGHETLQHAAGHALRTVDCDLLSILQKLPRVRRPHDHGNAQFAGYDRRMAGPPSMFGDDRGRLFHRWFPVGRCRGGHENIALPDSFQLAAVLHQTDRTATDTVADRQPLDNQLALTADMKLRQQPGISRCMDCLRSSLQDIQVAIRAVLGPFDIHRRRTAVPFAIMSLDGDCLPGKLNNFRVGETGPQLVRSPDLAPDRCFFNLGRRIDELDFLATDPVTKNGLMAAFQRRLVYQKFVRIGDSLHDCLTQPPDAGDHYNVTVAAFRIQRENYPGGGPVRADHPLDANRQSNILVRKTLVYPIGNGPLGEQRGETLADRIDQGFGAANIEEGFVLSREGSARQIFRRCATPHRDRHVATMRFAQLAVGLPNLCIKSVRQSGCSNHFAKLSGHVRCGVHVGPIR